MTNPLAVPALVTGERMDREEFLRRWEALPDLKHAELIDGVVFVPSPVSVTHCFYHTHLDFWIAYYTAHTPGLISGAEGTCYIADSAPQPDVFLIILPEYGGRTRRGGTNDNYLVGAPELLVEVSVSTADADFGPKLALYQRTGVNEYVTVETQPKRLVWRVLIDGSYRELHPGPDGILRSHQFPGLWLDPAALFRNDRLAILSTLQQGMATPEYAAFQSELAARRA